MNRKRIVYNERILQIDHDTFAPLVSSLNGSMGGVFK